MNQRSVRQVTVLAVATLLLGACAQAPAAPSTDRSSTSADQASVAEQTLLATAAPVEAADGGSGSTGTTLTVGTDDDAALLFVPRTLEAPADTPVTLTFNNSSTQPHNLQIPPPIKAKTKLVAAGGSETIAFRTPAAGTYTFFCTLHEYMVGRILVK